MAKKRPAPSREDALKVARYLGCSGAHQDESGTWFPCANAETMNRISNEAEPKSAERRKRGKRRRFVQDGYEPLGSRGVLGIDTIPGVGLVSGKTIIIGRAQPRRGDPDVYDDPNAARLRSRALGCIGIARRETPDGEIVWTPCTNVSDFRRVTGQSVLGQREESRRFARRLREVGGPAETRRRTRRMKSAELDIIEVKAQIYTKKRLRDRIKDRIMAGSRGGKPGQWSARKAQLLAIEYRRAGGGYRGEKKKPQRSLDKWTREEWTTSDGKPAIRKGGTTRYLPKKAWGTLTPAQRAATNRKKRTASVTGAQFVANTERAREAGRAARNSSKGADSPETLSGRIDRVKRRF